jgi:hypothetical protein
MRDDLTASEKRLIAALDRLDHFIDRAARRGAGRAMPPSDLAGIEAELHAARPKTSACRVNWCCCMSASSAAA